MTNKVRPRTPEKQPSTKAADRSDKAIKGMAEMSRLMRAKLKPSDNPNRR